MFCGFEVAADMGWLHHCVVQTKYKFDLRNSRALCLPTASTVQCVSDLNRRNANFFGTNGLIVHKICILYPQ